jgi:hypothetical protein
MMSLSSVYLEVYDELECSVYLEVYDELEQCVPGSL